MVYSCKERLLYRHIISPKGCSNNGSCLKNHNLQIVTKFYMIFNQMLKSGIGIVENLAGTKYPSVPKKFRWPVHGTHRDPKIVFWLVPEMSGCPWIHPNPGPANLRDWDRDRDSKKSGPEKICGTVPVLKS